MVDPSPVQEKILMLFVWCYEGHLEHLRENEMFSAENYFYSLETLHNYLQRSSDY